MENTINRIRKFRKDREWDQFHSPSNLAKAISIEAAELLEEFLWDNENYNKQNVEEELADVMVYCLQMADALNVDINDIINIQTSGFSPLFSAGDILIHIISNAVYFENGFIFNDVNYNYTKSYVDSLYVLTENGDLNSTKVELASYNPDAAHVHGTLSYDFDKGTWVLLDFYADWERS